MSYEAGSGVLGSLLLLMWAEALEKNRVHAFSRQGPDDVTR
jgi:hypothetical protein